MERKTFFVSLVVVALAGLLFAVDLALPRGVSAGSSYVVVVLLAAWMTGKRAVLVVAGVCTALTILGFLLSADGGLVWMSLTNRGIAVAAIWGVACLALRRRRSEEALREANRELDSFVHTVSHDLRSPLSPILGYAEYLREEFGPCLGEEGKAALAEIDSQGLRMLALLDDLLQLALVGSMARPSAPVDVEAVVSQVLAGWQEKAAQNGDELRCGPLPPVAVPESMLAQIFDNLVGNAVRYAAGAGPIEIGGERQGERVRYWVRDHGPGTAPEEREEIFDPFARGRAGRSARGTGLGLATVRKIASHFGGRAWVEETPGGGSTFWVELIEPS